jgi:purine-binding chemotaxis protein CheW
MSEILEIKGLTELSKAVDNSDLERYFVFTLNRCFYAVMASYVVEVVYLPELALLNTAPAEVAGVFDLRGVIIPVIDLSLRLKLPKKTYSVSSCVVILTLESHQFGIIVDTIYDVTHAERVENDSMLYANELNNPSKTPLLTGSLKKDQLLITLLDPYVLLEQDVAQSLSLLEEKDTDETGVFCPLASEKERQIFKERAENLRQVYVAEDSSQHLDLVAIAIAEEYFGIELKTVYEFAEVNDIVPIPGTPSYIKGCMNLRGNVITLLDIRKMLNLDNVDSGTEHKAVIVDYEDMIVGILVDNIIEVIYIHPDKVTQVPTAIAANGSSEYLIGEVLYQNKLLTLINLPLLLKKLA